MKNEDHSLESRTQEAGTAALILLRVDVLEQKEAGAGAVKGLWATISSPFTYLCTLEGNGTQAMQCGTVWVLGVLGDPGSLSWDRGIKPPLLARMVRTLNRLAQDWSTEHS